MTRYSIYKNGHVTEQGKVIDPIFISSGTSEKNALIKAKVNDENKENYHCIKEQFDGVYWLTIEGSEIIY